jgi:hypothetical protein
MKVDHKRNKCRFEEFKNANGQHFATSLFFVVFFLIVYKTNVHFVVLAM